MPSRAGTLSRAALLMLACLSLLICVTPILANEVVQDPLEAQASSFGWLAIRNFTYCLSSNPDPPNKPRGVQPKKGGATTLGKGQERLTGMGDSVVVLYHPEDTNKAIAWCNTLVAFQSTPHVQCSMALPTCQRCDAIRSKSGTGSTGAVQDGKAGRRKRRRAPSKKLGPQKWNQPVERFGGAGDGGSGVWQKRGNGNNDPSDAWVPLPGSDAQVSPPTRGITGRPFGTSLFGGGAGSGVDVENDAGLEAAISEFQDYCENKLTLAVRADCPFHIVKDWSDEPPFDLHRFCMSLRGSDGHTLHSEPGTGNSLGGASRDASGTSLGKDDGANGHGTKAPVVQGGEVDGTDGTSGRGRGAMDPNDPIVPFPNDGGVAAGQPKVGGKR